jgi:large repetitive protein
MGKDIHLGKSLGLFFTLAGVACATSPPSAPGGADGGSPSSGSSSGIGSASGGASSGGSSSGGASSSNSSSGTASSSGSSSGASSSGGSSSGGSSSGSSSGGGSTANCPKGTAYVDGCSGAATGTPAFPSMLSSYPSPPPWNVAGVDYPVGIPAGTNLQDPTTASLPAGCALNGTTVTCSSDATLDGYDFSLHDGITLSIEGGSVTVQHCKFVVGSNQGALGNIISVSGSSNAAFLYDEIDGASIPVTAQQGQTVYLTNVGTDTFRYDYLHDSGGDMIDFAGGPQVEFVQYNLFKDIGLLTDHSDTLQWCASVVSDTDVSFDVMDQTLAGLGGMGLLEPNSECSGAAMSGLLVHNNTLISIVQDNFATGADVTQDAGNATADHVAVFDNYVDPTGIDAFTGSPWFPTGYYGDTLPQPSLLHGLLDMTSGKDIPVATQSSPTSQGYYTYPDASGFTPGLSDVYAIAASPSSGTVGTGQTVTFDLNMAEAWTVAGGTPSLTLSSGGSAAFAGGSGTSTLTFSYTVASGQQSSTLAIIGVSLQGATVKDAVGNSADLSGATTSFSGLSVSGM